MSIAEPMFEIELLEVKELLFQHPEHLCILSVFEGTVECSRDGHTYAPFRTNDILLVNSEETCLLRGKGDNVVFVLKISYPGVEQYLGKAWHPSFCFSSTFDVCGRDSDSHEEKLCQALLKLLMSLYFSEARDDNNFFSASQHVFRLLYLLSKYYSSARDSQGVLQADCEDSQIRRILRKIEKDYGQDLRLNDLAGEEYVSASYLSRRFKAVMGMGFAQYLNLYRLKQAAHALRTTDLPVSKVAMNCGFSTISNFNKQFKNEFGMTPRDYTSRYRDLTPRASTPKHAEDYRRLSAEESTRCISRFLVNLNTNITLDSGLTDIRVSAAEGERRRDLEWIVNVGDADNLLQNVTRYQLGQLLEHVKPKYLRMYGFPRESYQEDYQFLTTFSYLNSSDVLRFIFQKGLTPIIVLSADTMTSQPQQLAFLRNILRNYNLQFDFPEILVELQPSGDAEKDSRIVRFFRQFSNVHIGFGLPPLPREDTQKFCADLWGTEGAPKAEFLSISANTEEEMEQVYSGLEELRRLLGGRVSPKLFVTNWNIGKKKNTSPIDYYSLRSGELLEAIKRMSQYADALGIWLSHQINTASNEQAFRISSVYHMGDVKRPIFYTVLFWKRLKIQDSLFQSGEHYIMTSREGKVSILLYNNQLPDQGDGSKNALVSNAISVDLTISQLRPGKYLYKRLTLESAEIIRKMVNAIPASEGTDGRGDIPTDIDVARYFEHTLTPRANVQTLQVGGSFSAAYRLGSNDCCLIVLYRLSDDSGPAPDGET